MKRNTNLRKVTIASLAFLISALPILHATATDLSSTKEELVPSQGQLRDHNYYKGKLQELEGSTARIHAEVDRILKEFRQNMEEYYRRTRGTGTTVDQQGIERKARNAEQEAAAEKEAAEEEAAEVAVKEHLQELLEHQPTPYEMLIGKKLVGVLGHQPTKNEFFIGQDYWPFEIFSKEFIAAAVYLRYQLGIRNETITLIKEMEELLKEKGNPILKDLEEKLESEIEILSATELTLEKRAELEDKELLLEQLKARDHQRSILGPDATGEQIEEGLRLGGNATQEQIEASMSASKILKEAKNKNRFIKDQLNSLDEVKAWIYLRDHLGMEEDMRDPDFLWWTTHNYIPKIIALKKERIDAPKWEEISPSINPSLKRKLKKILAEGGKWEKQKLLLAPNATGEQIEEGLRLGGKATQKQIEASLSASEILTAAGITEKSLKNLNEVKAWIYLRDNLNKEEDMKDPGFLDLAITIYIPRIIAFKRKRVSPSWEQINSIYTPEEQIKERQRLGSKATLEQIEASLRASEILTAAKESNVRLRQQNFKDR